MDDLRAYAPILHTGFADTYDEQQMKDFIEWCDERGFSGFSAEGKAHPPTNDIEGWLAGFIRGIRYASQEAEKKGLSVWLFDEWGYPTGTAGGNTLKGHTEWRSKKLSLAADIHLEQGQTVELTAPPHFLAAAVWPVGRSVFGAPLSDDTLLSPDADGMIRYTATHKRERLCVVTWEFDDFRTVGVFVPDREEDSQGTLDLLCYEAVAHFITQMHERYLPELSEHFGKAIKGFFYDEPFVSFPTPYTFDIFQEFEQKKGYDIKPLLPRMMAGLSQNDLLAYRDVSTSRVADAFYGQMLRWCHEHGVSMVGHQDLDHAVRTLDSVSGHFFKNSANNDAPGVDYIWTQIEPGRFADYPRFAGSARRLMGKEHAISESFAATTKCLYPDYMRFCMDHQIIRGIDKFFLMIADPVPEHGEFHTPLSKNHPQSVTFGAKLNRRVALANRLVNTAKPSASIAVYIPMEPVLRDLLNSGRPSSVSVSPYTPVWEYINDAAQTLCHLPVDYDYIWKEALLTLPLENGALVTPHGQRIDTIVMPPSHIFEQGISERLHAFISQGGKVLFISNTPEEFIGEGIVCPDAYSIAQYINPRIVLTSPAMISVAYRQNSDMDLFFLLNEDGKSHETGIVFNNAKSRYIQRYDFEKELWVDMDTPDNSVHESFAPMQLVVYAVCSQKTDVPPVCVAEKQLEITGWTAIIPCDGRVDLTDGLRDWREFYKADYTGWITYEAEIVVPNDGLYRLDLGEVCYAAKITVGTDEYLAAFAPYTADIKLTAGRHTLRVDVLNTEVNKNIGTPEAERANLLGDKRAWLKTKIGTDRYYLKSGLLGPVTLSAVTK